MKGQTLARELGAFDLMALGVGAIIGTGIFVFTGIAASQYAGPAVVLSFLIAGLACGCAALTYAEMGAMAPAAGGAYSYTYATLGEIAAWIMGWNLILEYALGSAAVAAGWSGYLGGILSLVGAPLPETLMKPPAAGGSINLPATTVTLVVTTLLVLGTRKSARFTAVLVAIKLGALVVFLALAMPRIDATNWTPFMPFGISGVSRAAALMFFAFLGFDAISTAAEETRRPNRDVPIGILGAMAVCAAIYMLVGGTLTGVVRYTELNTPEPLALALRGLGYPWGSALVAAGAMCGMTTVLLLGIYGQTRIFYAMARDGLLPKGLVALHPRFATPHRVTWLTGGACAAACGFLPIQEIAELTNIGTLFAFAVVALSVMLLRVRRPEAIRPFRCPAVYIVAPAAIVTCGYLMTNLPAVTWLRLAIWTAVGLAIYAIYGRRHARASREASQSAGA